jgi:hypothetical protein
MGGGCDRAEPQCYEGLNEPVKGPLSFAFGALGLPELSFETSPRLFAPKVRSKEVVEGPRSVLMARQSLGTGAEECQVVRTGQQGAVAQGSKQGGRGVRER